ncbi:hypothetical protein ONJ23_27530, partial [Salmonella enterica subsp. enterica serovar Virginia]|nr:hypothetical protein [Salmonella enterica subsp. enterica serovar Virginia]
DVDEQPRGPFIVCVDTSGSMGGFNEQCAKAFCLALMRVALADAVSHALMRLRDALNDPLFRREGNRQIATPYAQALRDKLAPVF